MVPILIHSRRPTHACAHDRVPSRDRAAEYTPKSHLTVIGILIYLCSLLAQWTLTIARIFFGSGYGSECPWGNTQQRRAQALPRVLSGCYGSEALRRNAPRRTTVRSTAADAPKPRRHSADREHVNGTGCNSSCPACPSGTRKQIETGVKGGAHSRLLEPHRILLGYIDAA
eukprot:724742-Pleurochrysis_carterae.AAC.1